MSMLALAAFHRHDERLDGCLSHEREIVCSGPEMANADWSLNAHQMWERLHKQIVLGHVLAAQEVCRRGLSGVDLEVSAGRQSLRGKFC